MTATFKIIDYNYVFDSTVELNIDSASEATGFPVTNLRNFHRSKVWRTTSGSNQKLLIDLKTIEDINSFLIIPDKEALSTFEIGQTLVVYGNATNEWSAPAATITPNFDATSGIFSYFESTTYSYRYWRLQFDDPTIGTGYFEFPKIFLGKATTLSQMPEIGIKLFNYDQSKIARNDYGHEYADTQPSRRGISISYKNLTETDKNTIEDIYERCGKSKPIAVCLDNEQSTFSDRNRQLFYGFLDNDFSANHSFYNFFDVEMVLREAM